MALLFMDGFAGDDATVKWNPASSNYTATNTTPRVPGGYYASYGTSGSLIKVITPSSQVFTGIGMYLSLTSQVRIMFAGDVGATTHITVCKNMSTHLLEIRRGTTAGTLLATGTTTIPIDAWIYFEVSCTISDTVGNVEVRLNGNTTPELTYNGDTRNGGTLTDIDTVTVGAVSGNYLYLADAYICNNTGANNNTFLGDVAVRVLRPDSDGAFSQLTGSDGNQVANYQQVDDAVFSGTDYNGSATVGHMDTYGFTNVPGGVSTIYGLQLNSFMAKSDATLGQARNVLRVASTNYTGTTRALFTSYLTYTDMFELNPNTTVAWTVSDVDSIEAGMEVV